MARFYPFTSYTASALVALEVLGMILQESEWFLYVFEVVIYHIFMDRDRQV